MRRANFATILVVLAQAWVYGCSSADAPGGDDTATGGTGATGGSGGSTGGAGGATGGSGGSTGGTSAAGTGGTGSAVPPECKGIKTNMSCPMDGLHCAGLVCGLGDSGTRTCDCATNWTCTACDWTNSPFAWAKSKPTNITTCTGVEQDGAPCTMVDATCEGAANSEACVCFLDDEGMLIWDCDKPPGTWAAAAN